MIHLEHVEKTFTLHNQDAAEIPVLRGVGFAIAPGECVALTGPSGAGKSTIMRMIYGDYLAQSGRIEIGGVDIRRISPRQLLKLRRDRIGYVSQFLRATPRTPCREVIAEPLFLAGMDAAAAREKAEAMLTRLRIPDRLWPISPTTFSGGERQRVNIARGFVRDYPALLLDEPTASLDAKNRETVLELIEEARGRGAAILGIFHDAEARARVCTREIDVSEFTA